MFVLFQSHVLHHLPLQSSTRTLFPFLVKFLSHLILTVLQIMHKIIDLGYADIWSKGSLCTSFCGNFAISGKTHIVSLNLSVQDYSYFLGVVNVIVQNSSSFSLTVLMFKAFFFFFLRPQSSLRISLIQPLLIIGALGPWCFTECIAGYRPFLHHLQPFTW